MALRSYFRFSDPPPAAEKPARIIDAAKAAECAAFIATTEQAGIVKGRKGTNSIVVDEIQWALLPFAAKQELLLAVGCDSSYKSRKPELVNSGRCLRLSKQ